MTECVERLLDGVVSSGSSVSNWLSTIDKEIDNWQQKSLGCFGRYLRNVWFVITGWPQKLLKSNDNKKDFWHNYNYPHYIRVVTGWFQGFLTIKKKLSQTYVQDAFK